MLRGVTGSWSLTLSIAIGAWLMLSPAAFGIGIEEPAADSDHLVAALVVVFAVISLAEVARPVRFLNVPLGLWLVATPWFLAGASASSRANDLLAGLAIALLSLPLVRLRDHYGRFDRIVLWKPVGSRLSPTRASR